MNIFNIILDLCIALIAGVTIYLAYKRGFVKTFISAISSVLAILIVMLFTVPLANALASTSAADTFRDKTAVFIDELVAESDAKNTLELVQDKTGKLYPVLETVGIDTDEFADWLDASISQTEEVFRKNLVEYISGPVATLVMRAVAMLVLYFGSLILLKIAASFLSGLFDHLPFFKQANHMLGFAMGAVMALVYVFVFCAVIGILINTSSLTGFAVFDQIEPEKTILYRWFDAIQILGYLF